MCNGCVGFYPVGGGQGEASLQILQLPSQNFKLHSLVIVLLTCGLIASPPTKIPR